MSASVSVNYRRSLDVRNKTWNLAVVTVVFLIEFLLPSALSSYGVFFNEFVEDDWSPFHSALWTPVVFIASWNIINPWSRKLGEIFKESSYILKLIAVIGTLIVSLGIGLCTLIKTLAIQITFYGVCGGAGTSITLTQIKIYTYDNFNGKPGIFESILQIAKVISIFIFPHCVLFLAEHYGVFKAQAIFGALLLNAIPFTLLLPRNLKKSPPKSLSRYRTVPGYLQDSIELPTINKGFSKNIKQINLPRIKTKYIEEEDDSDTSSSSNDSFTLEDVNEPVPKFFERFKNDMGVEILPEIPEEDELCDDNSRKINDSIKRLSKISDKFMGMIEKNNRSDHSNLILGFSELENGIQCHRRRYMFRNIAKSSGTCCCTPYRNYLFSRRCRIFANRFHSIIMNPLKTSIKCFYFYPALFCKTCMALTFVIYISIIPHVALVNGATYSVDITEAVFLLTFISVAWCFFLISLPWVINMSDVKIRILHILGLLLTSGSYFLVYLSVSHDMITLSCLIFGLGYGTTSFVEEMVYKETLGITNWKLVAGTLETLSGVLIILIYFLIYILRLKVHDIFLVFHILVSVNTILWILAPLINLSWTYFKKRKRNHFFI